MTSFNIATHRKLIIPCVDQNKINVACHEAVVMLPWSMQWYLSNILLYTELRRAIQGHYIGLGGTLLASRRMQATLPARALLKDAPGLSGL